MPAPNRAAVRTYLGTSSATDAQIDSALAAELATQARVCRVPKAVDAVWPADLTEAALRRVARNLAMRGIPLAVFQGDAENGSLTPPGRDPEVRRLEGPLRRLKVG